MMTPVKPTHDDEMLALIRETCRRFGETLQPHIEEWDRQGIFPRSVWEQAGEAGLLCADVGEEYGGAGASFRASMAIQEELNKLGLSAVAVGLTVHSDIVAQYIVNQGTEAQKQQYLPKMVSGECIGAILMTEPGTGSDLQGVGTTAVEDGDDFIVNGAKTFITNGQHADLGIVVAQTSPQAKGSRGMSLLLVNLHAPGVERGRNLEKIGLHAADTSELFFEDVRVPKSALLGELNRGFGILMDELARERLALSVGAIAASRGALDLTIEYVKERKAFGKPIAEFQNTRFELARMETDYQVNRAFVDECVTLFETGELDATRASMAKLASTEAQGRICDGCLQLFGGYGYMSEYPISRAFVDARVQRIYGGTSEIMKELISRSLLA